MKKERGRLVGMHIYRDDRNRYIFYNVFDKKGYWINDEDEYKKYVIYQARLPLAIVVGFLIITMLQMPVIGIVAGILVYGLMSFFFYTKFIPSLKVVNDFKKPESSYLDRLLEPLSPTRIMIASILSFAMSILLYINVQISDFDELTSILNYILAAIVFIIAIVFFVSFFSKKKSMNK